MLALKSVSLSYIFRKLSTLTCFFLLVGLGESCFLTSANAQQVSGVHLIQAKSELSFSKNGNDVNDREKHTVIASGEIEPSTSQSETNIHEASSEQSNDAEGNNLDSADQESSAPSRNLEKQIIAELNRVRTNPQAYADWLESQKQHYQGMILNLPGERSLRTNRGLRTLNEAISFVRAQQPLPTLADNEDLITNAQAQVAAIIDQQKIDHHTNNFVYNRLTPEAIVMQLVVDDGFPDRRHRLAVFQEDYQHTGIACQELEIYQQVCAIAYENKPLEIIQDSDVQVATNSAPTSKPDSTNKISDNLSSSSAVNSEVARSQPSSEPEQIIETKSPAIANPPSASLPAPPSAPTEVIRNSNQETNAQAKSEEEVTPPASVPNQPESSSSSVSEQAIAANPATEEVDSSANSVAKTGENASTSDQDQPSKTATETKSPETKPETEVVATANTVKPAQVAEIVESGILEDGDEVVPNDGSFYDSFPLEGSAGDSFSISLESQDFDTFLAVMDPEGNIIEKNDDINEETSNSRLEITLPDDGSYSVIVNAYDQGGKGKYTLKVSQ